MLKKTAHGVFAVFGMACDDWRVSFKTLRVRGLFNMTADQGMKRIKIFCHPFNPDILRGLKKN